MRLAEEKGQSAASRQQHAAVMVDEVVRLVRALNPLTIVDVTVGMGGHAAALLRSTDAHLLGIDRDAEALKAAAANLAEFSGRVTLRQADFAGFDAVLDQCGFPCVGAIVADLGMSSFALDDAERGFSFRLDGPLDMRMDRGQHLRAYDIVNEETESARSRPPVNSAAWSKASSDVSAGAGYIQRRGPFRPCASRSTMSSKASRRCSTMARRACGWAAA